MVIGEIFFIIFFIFIALSFSPVGKVVAESYFYKKQNNELLLKYNELLIKYQEHEEEIQKLREIVIFNEDKMKKLENNDITNKNKIKDQFISE
ncbi:MAG: hypothetical protein U0354_18285 [Candidatus Sericytochromatia bacterium]